jgi:hypothetical protein
LCRSPGSEAEFLVNTTTLDHQYSPSVAAFSDGRFVSVWTDNHPAIDDSGGGATDIARTMALYACARSTALMIASAVPFLTGSDGWLQAMAWSMIIVQACDAVIGGTTKNPMTTYGPAGTALLNFVAVVYLSRIQLP